jgi:hypothetical protein
VEARGALRGRWTPARIYSGGGGVRALGDPSRQVARAGGGCATRREQDSVAAAARGGGW